MTAEDIANGIVYSDNFDILLEVPNQESIRISNLTTLIYGTSETDYAFRKSANTLRSFSFMDNPILKIIGGYAFYQCTLLESVDLSSCSHLETIETYAFGGCKNVQTLLLPKQKLSTLGKRSFQEIAAKTVTIPCSITNMNSAFTNSLLEEVIFEEGSSLASIGWGTFSYTKIHNFTIPASVNGISGSAFQCTEMRYINVDERNKNFVVVENALYNKDMTSLIFYPMLCNDTITIPETVTMILDSVFYSSSLQAINLPSHLQTFKSFAFAKSSIRTIFIPRSVSSIEDSAFSDSNLEEVVFEEPSIITKIPDSCFFHCLSLKKVILPSTITEIGGGAFTRCSEDITITFAEGTTLRFDQMNSLILSDNDKILSCYVKINDKSEISIPEPVETIKKSCFDSQKHITKIIFLGNNLKTIEEKAFYSLSSLTDLVLPSSVQYIGSSAFSMSGITSIKLSHVTLDSYTFSSCVELETVEINETSLIPQFCFASCKQLKSIVIRKNLGSISKSGFSGCSKLTSFNEELCPSTKKRSKNIFYVPITLTSIGENAFKSVCIDQVIYEDGSLVEEVGNFSFYMSKITSIELPSSIKIIGVEAFAYTNLISFTVPQEVTLIDRKCFSFCTQLESFNIDSDCCLSDFGESVFISCTKLKEIRCQSKNFIVLNDALYDKNLTKLIIYPPASPHTLFSLPQSVKTISISSFYGASKLKSIHIPDDSVIIIGANAFENCKNLQTITLPASINTIGANAFKGCQKIQCGQIVDLKADLIQSLLESAHFPKRGLKSCFAISCHQLNPLIARHFIHVSFLLLGFNSQ